jgi:hypothetical protein
MMRLIGLLAAMTGFVTLTTTAPAAGDTFDISTVTCQDLINISDGGNETDQYGMGAILYWIAGYSGTNEQATVIDFDSLKTDFDKIVAACKEQPKVGVLTVSERFLGENATEQGEGAIDLATITCEAVQKSDKKDEEGLGLILMWIAGYHAGTSSERVFDSEAFLKSTKEIGEYCTDNPNVGLMTAADKYMGTE